MKKRAYMRLFYLLFAITLGIFSVLAILNLQKSSLDVRSRANDDITPWCKTVCDTYPLTEKVDECINICPQAGKGLVACDEFASIIGLSGNKSTLFVRYCSENNPYLKVASTNYCNQRCNGEDIKVVRDRCKGICMAKVLKRESCDDICVGTGSNKKSNLTFRKEISCKQQCKDFNLPAAKPSI